MQLPEKIAISYRGCESNSAGPLNLPCSFRHGYLRPRGGRLFVLPHKLTVASFDSLAGEIYYRQRAHQANNVFSVVAADLDN